MIIVLALLTFKLRHIRFPPPLKFQAALTGAFGQSGHPEAIRKGIEDAKKNMIHVSVTGTTIPHEVIGIFGAGKVMLKPAVQAFHQLDGHVGCLFLRHFFRPP